MPKFKKFKKNAEDTKDYSSNLYSNAAIDAVGIVMDGYFKKNNVQGTPDAQFLLQNSDAIIKIAEEDPLETEGKPDQNTVEDFAKKINKNYRPLSNEEIAARNVRGNELRKKYSVFTAKHNILDMVIKSESPKMDRTAMCLLRTDLSPEGMKFNREIAELFSSDDPKSRELGYKKSIEQFMKTDLSKIDLTDDQYLVDHFEDLYPILTSAAEFANIVNAYQQYHPLDVKNEEDRAICEQLGTMVEMGFCMRQKIDIMCSPIYGQLRTEDLENLANYPSLDDVMLDEDGDPILASMTLFGGDSEADAIYMDSFDQVLRFYQAGVNKTLIMNTDLPKEERAETFKAMYWNKKAPEVRPLVYNEKIQTEARLRRNITEIKKHLPKFEISEEKIQSYLSDKRFRLHERAKNIIADQKVRHDILDEIPNQPESFNRSGFAMIRSPKSDADRQFNKQFTDNLKDPSYNGQNARKELFAEYTEKIKALDDEKIDTGNFSEEAAEYVLDNMDTLEVGMEFQRSNQGKESSLGFTVNQELAEDLKKVEDKGVVLGGIGRGYKELMSSDSFLVLPFEDLSYEDANSLMVSFYRNPQKLGLETIDEFTKIPTFKGHSEQHAPYEEASGHTYSRGDFEDTAFFDVNAYKQYIDQLNKDLGKTNHWYNLSSSSPEYNAFKKCAKDIQKQLKKWPNVDIDKLHKAHLNLGETANAYQTHVIKTAKTREEQKGKNANQKARFATAESASAFALNHSLDINLMAMEKYNATVNPGEKEAHQQQTAQEQHIQREQAQKDLETQKLQESYTPLTREKFMKKNAEEKTERIRAEIKTLPEGNLKSLKNSEIDLRKSLATAVSAKKFSIDMIKDELGLLITNEKMQQALKDMPDMPAREFSKVYREQADVLRASEPFRKLIADIKREDVAFMLQDDHNPTLLIRKLEAIMNKNKEKEMDHSPMKNVPATEKENEISTNLL